MNPHGLDRLEARERPRERLARLGAAALSDRELLAVIIGTGTRGYDALDVAASLLVSGLHGLAQRPIGDLMGARGVGGVKAARIIAALELGARLASTGARETSEYVRTPQEAARRLLARYGPRQVETFGCLMLDVRNRVRREAILSTGGLSNSVVRPRDVFQQALCEQASGLILFHNHPSGDPSPSEEDVAVTRRLMSAGALLG
ncbi:MAG: DNA repair protein RadC, partial [Vicinamibacteria bacterium]|nr:DNA repair protein RadC [Vicinamibacteria bacterium]